MSERLRTTPALHDLSDDHLDRLAPFIHNRLLGPGHELIRQGDTPDDLHVVVDGELDVIVSTSAGTERVSTVATGDIVGEIALVGGGARTSSVVATRACQVLTVERAGVELLLELRSDIADRLAEESANRLRRERLQRYLGRAFAGVAAQVIERIGDGVTWRRLSSGRTLFAEGDAADRAYLVVSGRLEASHRNGGSDEWRVEMGPGELVGEAALASSGRRTATVQALRDSDLAVLPREHLEAIARDHPRAVLEVIASSLQGQRHRDGVESARPANIVVVPVGAAVVDDFIDRLAEALAAHGQVMDLDSTTVSQQLGADDAAQADGFSATAVALEHWLAQLEDDNDFLLHRADASWTPWTRRCLRRADRVLLVGEAGADPAPGAFEQHVMSLDGAAAHVHRTLVLVHPRDTERPHGTGAWLRARTVRDHVHVRDDRPDDVERLARLLAGRGIALVLGGGGARGFAHLGVLRALDEQGVPLDVVVGTSIGSVMGAVAALQWDREHAMSAVRQAFHKQFDWTFPAVALLRGRRMTATIHRHFGAYDIADTWVPYRCLSTNLTTAESVVHHRGSLGDAVRASVSIPGVLPPVASNGDLLIDGGVLDNLPTRLVQDDGDIGTVMAVDVTPPVGPRARSQFAPAVSGWRQLFASVMPGIRPQRIPSLVETVTSTTVIASRQRGRRELSQRPPDLRLELDLKGVGLLEFNAPAVDRVEQRGYQSAAPMIQEWLASDAGQAVPTRPPHPDAAQPPELATPARRGRAQRAAELRGILLLTGLDLRHRAKRFSVATIGAAVVFTLLLLMTGLGQQLSRESFVAMETLGGEQWIVRDESGGPFTSATTVDPGAVPGAEPVLLARFSLSAEPGEEASDVVVVGGLTPPEMSAGTGLDEPGQAIVGAGEGHEVGDVLAIGDRSLSIVGEVEDGTLFAGVPLLIMSLQDAQAIVFDGRDVATALVANGTVAAPGGYKSLTNEQVAEDTLRPLERPIASVNLVRALLWVVAAMIVGAVVYLTSMDRARDVAVLRAVGTSSGWLLVSLVIQAVTLAVMAALVAAGLQAVIRPLFPLTVFITARNLLELPVFAAVVAVLASAGGIRRTLRTDPGLAFAGPGT